MIYTILIFRHDAISSRIRADTQELYSDYRKPASRERWGSFCAYRLPARDGKAFAGDCASAAGHRHEGPGWLDARLQRVDADASRASRITGLPAQVYADGHGETLSDFSMLPLMAGTSDDCSYALSLMLLTFSFHRCAYAYGRRGCRARATPYKSARRR